MCAAINRSNDGGFAPAANGAGWITVYDVLDDWKEFHRVGQASWYDEPFERHLLIGCDATFAINEVLTARLARLAMIAGLKASSLSRPAWREDVAASQVHLELHGATYYGLRFAKSIAPSASSGAVGEHGAITTELSHPAPHNIGVMTGLQARAAACGSFTRLAIRHTPPAPGSEASHVSYAARILSRVNGKSRRR